MADQPASKTLDISPEDLEKVYKARNRNEKTRVNSSWLFIAEFGYYFGWQGVVAIRTNAISMEEAQMLLNGCRKVWNGKLYDHATACLIGAGAAGSKKPGQTFKKLTKDLAKSMRADT